ncbi:MAG: ATP-grasp domain-containing protein [Sneathiellales bacterium]|nr:ATP-grasp domain-containing protein [Sneathiellales bacterium]
MAHLLFVDFQNNYSLARLPALFREYGISCSILAPENRILSQCGTAVNSIKVPEDKLPQTLGDLGTLLSFAVNRTGADYLLTNDENLLKNILSTRDLLRSKKEALSDNLLTLLSVLERSFLSEKTHYSRPTLLEHARKSGFHVPDYKSINSWQEVQAIQSACPYPAYFKLSFEAGGNGVIFASNEEDLSNGITSLIDLAIPPTEEHPMIMQEPASGQELTINFAAWEGKLLGYDVLYPLQKFAERGPSTVLRTLYRPDWMDPISALVKELGFSGLGGLDVFEQEESTIPSVIEVNLRPTHGLQASEELASPLLQLFSGQLKGCVSAPEQPEHAKRDRTVALFPDEYLRDRHSPHLTQNPVNIPWKDPKLFKGLLDHFNFFPEGG